MITREAKFKIQEPCLGGRASLFLFLYIIIELKGLRIFAFQYCVDTTTTFSNQLIRKTPEKSSFDRYSSPQLPSLIFTLKRSQPRSPKRQKVTELYADAAAGRSSHKSKNYSSRKHEHSKFQRVNPSNKQASSRTVKHGVNKLPHLDKEALSDLVDIDLKTQLNYSREGHAVIRKILSPMLLQSLRKDLEVYSRKESLAAWQQKVMVASGGNMKEATSCDSIELCQSVLDKKYNIPIYELPFLQFFNTWQHLPSVKDLVLSPLLGNAASQLMGIPRVRLYQDSLFVKRFGDGPTPWHVDARMAPFDTSHMITFWIPLQKIAHDGTGLHFVSKSHSDIALPYWNPIQEKGPEHARLEHRYGVNDDSFDDKPVVQHYMPMSLGDVTAHSGWTLHCSDSNDFPIPRNNIKSIQMDRYALAISYVDARAEIREDVMILVNKISEKDPHTLNLGNYLGDDEDAYSYLPWIRDVIPRRQFSHKLVPQVWPPLL